MIAKIAGYTFSFLITTIILVSCLSNQPTEDSFHVFCNSVLAEHSVPQSSNARANFISSERIKIKAQPNNSLDLMSYEWNFKRDNLVLNPAIEPIFDLPCDKCNVFIYDQSPNQKWQLTRIYGAEPSSYDGTWLISESSSIKIPDIIKSLKTWEWALDSTSFWSEFKVSGPAWMSIYVDLENETLTQFSNDPEENHLGIPDEKSNPSPVAGLINVTFSPNSKGVWYTDWINGISDEVNYYEPKTQEYNIVQAENVYRILWNPSLEQIQFLHRNQDDLTIKSLDGRYSAKISLSFFQELVNSDQIFDIMYTDLEISPDGQHLILKSSDSNFIILSCNAISKN